MNKPLYYSIILVVVTYWFYCMVKNEYHRLYCSSEEKLKIVYYDDFHHVFLVFIGMFFSFVVLPFIWLIYNSFTGFQKPKKIMISPFTAESLYTLEDLHH